MNISVNSMNSLLPTNFLLLILCFLLLIALTSLSIGVGVFCVGISIYCAIRKPKWLLLFLVAYIPFEPFLLKFVSQDFYVFARYGSEAIIYLLFVVLVFKKITYLKLPTINYQLLTIFAILLLISLLSLIINMVPLDVGVLGLRQIFRFILLFFVVLMISETGSRIKSGMTEGAFQRKFFGILFGIVLIQSILGIGQALTGGRLDEFLLPNDRKVIGSIQLTTGTKQFWEHGQRVFGTMGRYDQLGSFLAIMLLMIVAFLYEQKRFTIHDLRFMNEKSQITNSKIQINFNDQNSKLPTTHYQLLTTHCTNVF